MAKRGYKLQEFVAHSENVNCLSLGKKSRRLLITGGDDYKVNLWAIGKPASLMSLCGHTSSVESVAFNSEEVLVLAGSSSGVIKLWDLEESKLVRGLTGHRSNCTAVEFHPFGEFFASGSMDTDLKVWDIRKKGCIHTFKGHTRGISTIRFSPDGRWVVSGGFDNVVKVWDLTAGKLLHDFKFHEGHIRSIDFHPLEFLLATGSADRTVKYWDLETFELIGSTRPEATGVRNIAFHPDGKTLFCGSDDAFKVYSWEPVVCHDSVDIEWSTLGDLCIHEGKLLGCSYYQNSVGVWVADISHVKPYGGHTDPEQNNCMEKKSDLRSYSLEKAKSRLGISSDDEAKDIKNIYVDTAAGNPIASQRVGSLNPPKLVPPSDSYEISSFLVEKQSPAVDTGLKSNGQTVNRSIIEPKDTCSEKDSLKSGRESVTFSKTKPGMLLRPAHARKPSNSKCEVDKLLAASESGNLSTTKSKLDNESHLNSEAKNIAEDRGIKSCGNKCSSIKDDAEKFDKTASERATHNKETSKDFPDRNKDSSSVKIVKGVAVVPGRTRTLVERFEKKEKLNSNETETTVITPHMISETDRTVTVMKAEPQTKSEAASASDQNITESCLSRGESTSLGDRTILEDQITRTETSLVSDTKVTPSAEEPSTPIYQNTISKQLFQRDSSSTGGKASLGRQSSRKESTLTNERKVITIGNQSSRRESTSSRDEIMSRSQVSRRGTGFPYDRKDAATSIQISRRGSNSSGNGNIFARSTSINDRKVTVAERQSSRRDSTFAGYEIRSGSQINKPHPNFANDTEVSAYEIPVARRELISPGDETVLANQVAKMGLAYPTDRKVLTTESQISRRETESYNDGDVQLESLSASANDKDITEKLMETHDVFLSTLRSRLTKLQVVSHFWERNDAKGAISALQKLPDHSVKADVLSALMERKESFTLDLFSCLLPVLTSMLNSQMERHVSVSLEMLLKLVAVFGPGINSTISAPRSVGVDLHAEQRREWCNQCFMQLQKIQKLLPAITRRGGSLARSAEELNLVLQQS